MKPDNWLHFIQRCVQCVKIDIFGYAESIFDTFNDSVEFLKPSISHDRCAHIPISPLLLVFIIVS